MNNDCAIGTDVNDDNNKVVDSKYFILCSVISYDHSCKWGRHFDFIDTIFSLGSFLSSESKAWCACLNALVTMLVRIEAPHVKMAL